MNTYSEQGRWCRTCRDSSSHDTRDNMNAKRSNNSKNNNNYYYYYSTATTTSINTIANN